MYNAGMVTKLQLDNDLKDAMRARDDVRKRTLRMVLSALTLAEKDSMEELDEEGLTQILRKEAKSRNETIHDAERAGRSDLIKEAEAELAILDEYLPKMLSSDELKSLAQEIIAELQITEMKEMGQVMKEIMARSEGRADGSTASTLVRELLG
jgi:uncharacterized protein YqeY